MCGRITLLQADELADIVESVRQKSASRAGARKRAVHGAREQARVGMRAPVIAQDGNDFFATSLSWGITAPWNNKLVFNTRLESALGGSAFWKDALGNGRCIVPAASFFETHATQTLASPKTGRPVKAAYEFQLPDDEPLLMAGLHQGCCFTVMTTQPNADVAPIHPRMPLVLRFQELPVWLYGGPEELASLADRSAVRLSCAPDPSQVKPPESQSSASQLSLF